MSCLLALSLTLVPRVLNFSALGTVEIYKAPQFGFLWFFLVTVVERHVFVGSSTQWHRSFHGVPPAGSTVSVCLIPDGDLANAGPQCQLCPVTRGESLMLGQ